MNRTDRTAARERVLVIAPHSSYRTAPFLSAAQRLDVDVLVASRGRHSIVSSVAEGLHVDFENPEAALAEIVRESRKRPFAGIVGTDDATTVLAALAAETLGLPHNPLGAVRTARRKDLARARLAQAGIPVPRHWRACLREPLAPQAEAVTFPCVLKPIAMSASRGVIRADNNDEFLRAAARIDRILEHDAVGEERDFILVEEFIPGLEVAVEAILTAGRLEVLAVFDKPDPLDGPFFEETYYITPTRLSGTVQAQLRRRLTEACAAYGLREGPIHAECRINDRGVWILEVAARTIGGLCARLLRFGTGYGLEELVLSHLLGRPLTKSRQAGAAGVLMIPITKSGILRRVEGIIAAQRVRYVEEVSIQVREGYELVPLPEASRYLGFVFAYAPTADAAEAALRSAYNCLNVVVAPLWKGRTGAAA